MTWWILLIVLALVLIFFAWRRLRYTTWGGRTFSLWPFLVIAAIILVLLFAWSVRRNDKVEGAAHRACTEIQEGLEAARQELQEPDDSELEQDTGDLVAKLEQEFENADCEYQPTNNLDDPEHGRPCANVLRDIAAVNKRIHLNDEDDNPVLEANLEALRTHYREEHKHCELDGNDEGDIPVTTEAMTPPTTEPPADTVATCEAKGTWAVSQSDPATTKWLEDGLTPNDPAAARTELLTAIQVHPDLLVGAVKVFHTSIIVGDPAELTWQELIDEEGCLTDKGKVLYIRVETLLLSQKWVWEQPCTVGNGTGINADGNIVMRDGLGRVAEQGCYVFVSVAMGEDPANPNAVETGFVLGSVSKFCGNINPPDKPPHIPPGPTPEPPPEEPPPPPPSGKNHEQSPVSSDPDDPDEVTRPNVPAPPVVIRPPDDEPSQPAPPSTVADPDEVMNPEPIDDTVDTDEPAPPDPTVAGDPDAVAGDTSGDGIPD